VNSEQFKSSSPESGLGFRYKSFRSFDLYSSRSRVVASFAGVLVIGPGVFFFTLVTGPRRSLSLELSDTRIYAPQIRARLECVLSTQQQVPSRKRSTKTIMVHFSISMDSNRNLAGMGCPGEMNFIERSFRPRSTAGPECDPKGSMAFLQNQFRCLPMLGARRT